MVGCSVIATKCAIVVLYGSETLLLLFLPGERTPALEENSPCTNRTCHRR
jgi:hypothetical protein